MEQSAARPTTKRASCLSCRRRKIKCDKELPCSSCTRTGLECVPLAPSGLPRGRRGGRTKEIAQLQQQVTRLEDMLKSVGDKIATGVPTKEETQTWITRPRDSLEVEQQRGTLRSPEESIGSSSGDAAGDNMRRYLGSSFWVSLSDGIAGLRDIFGEISEDEEDSPEPFNQMMPSLPLQNRRSNFVLGGFDALSEGSEIVRDPSRAQIYALCTIYLQRIDPVLKIVHGPSLSRHMREAKQYLDYAPGDKGVQALAFAVYYAAVTSLSDDECRQQIGDSKQNLLGGYNLGVQQALADADLVNTTDLVTLQAFTIFLLCVRCHESSRFTWTMIGLAVRIAHALSLHRDDSLTMLRPFEREMRRRLWWQISVLDVQASHDRASDPVILPGSFDTQLPLNVNDEDLSFHGESPLHEREGLTGMTFCLVTFYLLAVIRQLMYVRPSTAERSSEAAQRDLREKIALISASRQRVEARYLQSCDQDDPSLPAIRKAMDICIGIMWLVVRRPLQRGGSGEVSRLQLQLEGPSNNILAQSVRVLELALELEQIPSQQWLTRTYVQWHALAVTLAELCVQSHGPIVQRAWKAVDEIFDRSADRVADSSGGLLWRPIKKLMRQAQLRRPGPAGTIPVATTTTAASTSPGPVTLPEQMRVDQDAPAPLPRLASLPVLLPLGPDPAVDPAPPPFEWDRDGTLGGGMSDQFLSESNEEMGSLAWTDWMAFVDDFRLEGDAMLL